MKERISYLEYPAGLLDGMYVTQAYLDSSGIDPGLLELLYMRVSQINSCAYCIDMHYKKGIHYGEEPLKLISVSAWRETPYYTEKEQAVLEFAEKLTHMPPEEHNDSLHHRLLSHFSKQEIADEGDGRATQCDPSAPKRLVGELVPDGHIVINAKQ